MFSSRVEPPPILSCTAPFPALPWVPPPLLSGQFLVLRANRESLQLGKTFLICYQTALNFNMNPFKLGLNSEWKLPREKQSEVIQTRVAEGAYASLSWRHRHHPWAPGALPWSEVHSGMLLPAELRRRPGCSSFTSASTKSRLSFLILMCITCVPPLNNYSEPVNTVQSPEQ